MGIKPRELGKKVLYVSAEGEEKATESLSPAFKNSGQEITAIRMREGLDGENDGEEEDYDVLDSRLRGKKKTKDGKKKSRKERE